MAGSERQSRLPNIHLLCMFEHFSDAFNAAVEKHFPNLHETTNITIHNCSLRSLPQDVCVDAVVSPANSYARLDGAFDDALSRAYSPRGDYDWLTRVAQRTLYAKWRGYAPPGTCTVIPLLGEPGAEDSRESLPWETKYLLLCPTMRIPWQIKWDREVVYECIWSLLCAVDQHNAEVGRGADEATVTRIETILMTPLGTGVGAVSAERWAEQCVLAMKHWVEATQHPEVWSHLSWETIFEGHQALIATHQEAV